jgi:hypothetical protein
VNGKADKTGDFERHMTILAPLLSPAIAPPPVSPIHFAGSHPAAFSIDALMARPIPKAATLARRCSPASSPVVQVTRFRQRREIPVPDIRIGDRPKLDAPAPAMFRDPELGEYGIRCVCGEGKNRDTMVQCELCDFWLHTECVNVGRLRPAEPYYCPFCLGTSIRCKCGESMAYNEPLIRCTKCHYWSHKSCEDLEYGIIPANFVCSACGTIEYTLPEITFSVNFADRYIMIECDRSNLVKQIVDGQFKTDLFEDLNSNELSFQGTIVKYFRKFAPLIFEQAPDFWKCFVDGLSALLDAPRFEILAAIDHLAHRLLYLDEASPGVSQENPHGFSDSIAQFIGQTAFLRFDRFPESIALFRGPSGEVHTPVTLDDNQFICELPCFLMHTDEVRADGGLDPSVLSVPNTEIVADLSESEFTLARHIRRSFHFNAIVKLARVSGEVRAALFATRTKGPLLEERGKRGAAIPAGGEVILPFDGQLPFKIQRPEWREKRQRGRLSPEPERLERGKGMRKTEKKKTEFKFSLLSAFTQNEVPPMPIILLPTREAVEESLLAREMRHRSKVERRGICSPAE